MVQTSNLALLRLRQGDQELQTFITKQSPRKRKGEKRGKKGRRNERTREEKGTKGVNNQDYLRETRQSYILCIDLDYSLLNSTTLYDN